MSAFAERLKNAMKYRNKTQTDIAVNCNIDKGNLSHYIKGDFEPKQNIIIKIAHYLNVSPSYLLGLDNTMTAVEIKPLNSLFPDSELDMKKEIIKEITAMLTWESLENLQVILPVVQALCKGGKQ